MKKTSKLTIVSLMLCAFLTTSVYSSARREYQNDSCEPCKKPEPCCDVPMGPTVSAYTAPGRIDPCGSWDMFTYADFLVMQPREDNLHFAVSTETGVSDIGAPLNGRFYNMDFDWEPAFRVGLGWAWDSDNWDITLEYTRVTSSETTSAAAPAGGRLFPSWGHPAPSTPLTAGSASASWKVRYNTIDLEMGRHSYVGKYFVLRPFFGLRGSWLPQVVHVQYNDLQDTNAASFGTTNIRSKFNNWGIGPRAGVDGSWMLGYDIRLITNAAIALEYTRLNSRLSELNPELAVAIGRGEGDAITDVTNCIHQFRPNWEMALGFGWGTYLSRNRLHLDLSVTYEYHVWLDQNSKLWFVDDVQKGQSSNVNGHFGMQGVAFRFRLDY